VVPSAKGEKDCNSAISPPFCFVLDSVFFFPSSASSSSSWVSFWIGTFFFE
jgi:hypothetical protein